MATSNQKKGFLIAWTYISEKYRLLQWNQWNKSRVRCKCMTSRVLTQPFSPGLQPRIQHFHFTSFWSQIQLNLTIYLSHRHVCRQIATTDSPMQYPRKTTNPQRTRDCWNSSSHIGSDHHQSTRHCYHRLFTPDRLPVLVPRLPEESKAWSGGQWKQLLPFTPRCCRANSCSTFQLNIVVTVAAQFNTGCQKSFSVLIQPCKCFYC